MTKKAAAALDSQTAAPPPDTPYPGESEHPTPEEARQMFKENDRLTIVMTTEGEMQRP